MNQPDLNRLVVVRRNVPGGANGLNEKVENWSDYKSLHAAREEQRDSERVAAGQASASVMSRFVVFSTTENRTITPKDRLFHDGSIWQIHGVKQYKNGGFRQYLEITASMETD